MTDRYWLILPNGGRQLLDPDHFALDEMISRAHRVGGEIEVEVVSEPGVNSAPRSNRPPRGFEPPISALGPLFRARLSRIYSPRVEFDLDMNTRPTSRMLGGYYRKRKLIRVYTHDAKEGRRPIEELFDTFLHELAHHLEYTEPSSFDAQRCQRVKGVMHSPLFWKVLADLKIRWAECQRS